MNRRRDQGQALVEFAIIIPVFLALLFGIVDFGRVIWATSSLSNAASEGARFAIVHGGSQSTPCPVGNTIRDVSSGVTSSCPFPVSPSTDAIKTVATNAAIAVGPVSVAVCYGKDCTGDTGATTAGGANSRGTPVTVVVSGTVSLFTPSLLGIKSIPVSGTSTMMVNH